MTFAVDQKQYNALSALRYHIADKCYMREHGAAPAELDQKHKTIISIFDELDALQVPFWVQNICCAIQDNWRHYLESYTYQDLEARGVDCSAATTR